MAQNTSQLAARHLVENVEAVSAIYQRAEESLKWRQRLIETVTQQLGRPLFLYSMLAFIAAWVGYNSLAPLFGARPFDPLPFSALQGLIGFGALLMATLVVITQNRQGRLEDHRAHIDLQVNLLAEKKIAKLIALVEELRRDLPAVPQRYDAEAEAMELPADPIIVADAIQKPDEDE
jgi:uncharacterized membrane protein